MGRALAINSSAEARQKVEELKQTDKKVSKATHNITAWRICDPKTGELIDQGMISNGFFFLVDS